MTYSNLDEIKDALIRYYSVLPYRLRMGCYHEEQVAVYALMQLKIALNSVANEKEKIPNTVDFVSKGGSQ